MRVTFAGEEQRGVIIDKQLYLLNPARCCFPNYVLSKIIFIL